MTASQAGEQISLLGDSFQGFRTVQYLGSKYRLLHVIGQAIQEVAGSGGLVCDLFSGSGVVSRHLAQDYDVVAYDIQEYARVLASALLRPVHFSPAAIDLLLTAADQARQEALTAEVRALIAHETESARAALGTDASPLADIVEHGSVLSHVVGGSGAPDHLAVLLEGAAGNIPGGSETVLTRYYGGVYFSYEQAVALDALASAVRSLRGEARDTAMAALVSTASQVVSTVGSHFAQPVRPRRVNGRAKTQAVRSIALRRQQSVMDIYRSWLDRYCGLAPLERSATAERADYRDALASMPSSVTAVYADPPYTRDHYSRFYHVLETLALGDEPDVSLVKIGGQTRVSRGLYRRERHQSPFCIKSQVVGAFESLFSAVAGRSVPLVLSYSPYTVSSDDRPRLMTIDQLRALAARYFTEVDIGSAGRIAHSKLNSNDLNTDVSYNAEVLIRCVP